MGPSLWLKTELRKIHASNYKTVLNECLLNELSCILFYSHYTLVKLCEVTTLSRFVTASG